MQNLRYKHSAKSLLDTALKVWELLAVKWTRLSCRSMRANAVRRQFHALAYTLADFLRTLPLPKKRERWSLTTLREKVVKSVAKVIAYARYTVFQMAAGAAPQVVYPRIFYTDLNGLSCKAIDSAHLQR